MVRSRRHLTGLLSLMLSLILVTVWAASPGGPNVSYRPAERCSDPQKRQRLSAEIDREDPAVRAHSGCDLQREVPCAVAHVYVTDGSPAR